MKGGREVSERRYQCKTGYFNNFNHVLMRGVNFLGGAQLKLNAYEFFVTFKYI